MRRPPQLGQNPRPRQRERHEPLQVALGAAQAREAVSQHPTSQEVSELPFHEVGQRAAIRVTADRLEKGVEVLDHAVQHGVLGVAWPVVARAEGHNDDIGAPADADNAQGWIRHSPGARAAPDRYRLASW